MALVHCAAILKVLGLHPVTSQDCEALPIHTQSARAREDAVVIELSEEAFMAAMVQRSRDAGSAVSLSSADGLATNDSGQRLASSSQPCGLSRSTLITQGLAELESVFRSSGHDMQQLQDLGLVC